MAKRAFQASYIQSICESVFQSVLHSSHVFYNKWYTNCKALHCISIVEWLIVNHCLLSHTNKFYCTEAMHQSKKLGVYAPVHIWRKQIKAIHTTKLQAQQKKPYTLDNKMKTTDSAKTHCFVLTTSKCEIEDS